MVLCLLLLAAFGFFVFGFFVAALMVTVKRADEESWS